MNICCIYSVDDFVPPDRALPSYSAIPFGLSYIATALKQAGHNPNILVLTAQSNISAEVGEFMELHSPKLFCLTAVSSQYPTVCRIAETIKQADRSIHIILGGHHATLNPNDAISNHNFDAICIGEGEKAVVEYASQIDADREPSGISNLWIRSRDGQCLQRNPAEPFVEDLDALPHIDRTMWDKWVSNRNGLVSVLLGRGCPNRCTYCSNHALKKTADGKYVRFRSPDDVIDELNEITEQYPQVDRIHLEVETFQASKRYMHEMCERLERFVADMGRPMTFGVNLVVTPAMADDATLMEMLKRAHFGFVNIGLESGSERIRKEVLRRPRYSNGDLEAFCRNARRCGIKVALYVLVGIPGETPADFKETVACVRRCEPHEVHLSIFYPYPGTDLYDKAAEMGISHDRETGAVTERKAAVLDLPGFSRQRIQREYVWFPYKVYRGRKPLRKIAPLVVRGYLGKHPRLHSLYRRMMALT